MVTVTAISSLSSYTGRYVPAYSGYHSAKPLVVMVLISDTDRSMSGHSYSHSPFSL